MDLSKLKPSESIIEIKHPATEELLGVRVTLISIHDDKLKKLKRKFLDERLKLEAKGKNFKAEEIDENRSQLAAAAITGWEWYGEASFQGTKPTFSLSNVLKVFEELSWFRDQVEEAIGENKNFFAS